jgi:hypothetical protein
MTGRMTGATGVMTGRMTGATGVMTGRTTGATGEMTGAAAVVAGPGCSGNRELADQAAGRQPAGFCGVCGSAVPPGHVGGVSGHDR